MNNVRSKKITHKNFRLIDQKVYGINITFNITVNKKQHNYLILDTIRKFRARKY